MKGIAHQLDSIFFTLKHPPHRVPIFYRVYTAGHFFGVLGFKQDGQGSQNEQIGFQAHTTSVHPVPIFFLSRSMTMSSRMPENFVPERVSTQKTKQAFFLPLALGGFLVFVAPFAAQHGLHVLH